MANGMHTGYASNERCWMVVRACAMGNTNSPDFAQATNLAVLERGGLRVEDFMRYGEPLPSSKVLGGVVKKFLGRISPSKDTEAINKSMASYNSAKLPMSLDRAFGFARIESDGIPKGALDFVTWGTQVKSNLGDVGIEDIKRSFYLHQASS